MNREGMNKMWCQKAKSWGCLQILTKPADECVLMGMFLQLTKCWWYRLNWDWVLGSKVHIGSRVWLLTCYWIPWFKYPDWAEDKIGSFWHFCVIVSSLEWEGLLGIYLIASDYLRGGQRNDRIRLFKGCTEEWPMKGIELDWWAEVLQPNRDYSRKRE